MRSLALIVGLSSVAFVAACDSLFDFGDPSNFVPNCAGGTAAVAGTWRIEGQGERTSCSDDALDTERLLLSSDPLRLVQNGTDVKLGTDLDGFELRNGRVTGRCLRFDTVETFGGFTIEYRFEAQLDSDGVLRGTFRGDGPGSCRSEGEFEASPADPG